MAPRLDTAALHAQLAVEGELMAATVETTETTATTGMSGAVPGLEWTVRDVFVHTGAVHRWAADIVRRALPTNETGGSRAFHPDLDDGALHDWFRDGHAELLAVLAAADEHLEAWTFGRPAPAAWFWTRRQAHETAIHRMDLQSVTGAVTDVPTGFAQDGIDELAAGFARSRAFAVAEPGTLLLAADDGPDWTIRFGGERIEAGPAENAEADAAVRGSSSDLYRWLWNRPSPAVVDGDADVAALWGRVRIT